MITDEDLDHEMREVTKSVEKAIKQCESRINAELSEQEILWHLLVQSLSQSRLLHGIYRESVVARQYQHGKD